MKTFLSSKLFHSILLKSESFKIRSQCGIWKFLKSDIPKRSFNSRTNIDKFQKSCIIHHSQAGLVFIVDSEADKILSTKLYIQNFFLKRYTSSIFVFNFKSIISFKWHKKLDDYYKVRNLDKNILITFSLTLVARYVRQVFSITPTI